MADSTTSPEKPIDPNSLKPDPDIPISQPDPSSNPNPDPPPTQVAPSSIAPHAPLLQLPPSFRPVAPPVPLPLPPQFSPVLNANFQAQNNVVQPPGVPPVPGSVPGSIPGSRPGGLVFAQLPTQRPPYMQLPNGYLPLPPPGVPRYPSMYPVMVRPVFPPRPMGIPGTNPALARPPVPGIRGPPLIPPVIRPGGIPSVTPAEKPQTTVYVGKIASTVDNDFILSILQLCGPVKSWKRPQDPTSGTLKGYGFCEFDSAEGILRAIRLLSKLNVDGQELMLNFNSATKEYLERYVQKKRENAKSSEAVGTEGGQVTEKEERNTTGSEKGVPSESTQVESKEDNNTDQKDQDVTKFGLVTDEDNEADRGALEKLNAMIEERLKTHPLPPPPPPPLPSVASTGSDTSNAEVQIGLKEGDMDVDLAKNDAADDRNEDETKSASKTPNEYDKPDTSSPHKSRKNDRSRDRERDAKREKERELERNEIDREQERAKRDRERQYKSREDERRYRLRLEDWELREKQKDQIRRLEREREEERAEERKYEIIDQEHESYDCNNKKRKHRSSGEERKRRQREKEDDLDDRLKEEEEIRLKEEEEIAEAKMRDEEALKKQKQEQEDAMRLLSASATKKSEEAVDEITAEKKEVIGQSPNNDSAHENHMTDRIQQNGTGEEICTNSVVGVDAQQSSNAQSRKLGFGLVASGKRTAVPSVFNEEDEDAQKEKKMRPLVPIEYTNEELQAVQRGPSGSLSPDLAAAAEFAKRITGVNFKEEKPEAEKDRSRRSHEKSSHRGQEWNDHGGHHTRDDNRKENVDHDKDRERQSDKAKTAENRKLLDAKQLIDTIPKTKDDLFSYKINWAIYDKNQLHERMRPWISKKITEFLGEEEISLVNYIVSTTQEHVNASEVLDRLQTILDDEAEMFVLKMWRMLIFEIKKVETGLAVKSKA